MCYRETAGADAYSSCIGLKQLMWEGSRRDLLGILFLKPGSYFAAVAVEGERE